MNIHDRIRDDDVSGVIVGKSLYVCQLMYDGRPQRGRHYAESEASAKEKAMAALEGIKDDLGISFGVIFPKRDGWSIKFLN